MVPRVKLTKRSNKLLENMILLIYGTIVIPFSINMVYFRNELRFLKINKKSKMSFYLLPSTLDQVDNRCKLATPSRIHCFRPNTIHIWYQFVRCMHAFWTGKCAKFIVFYLHFLPNIDS
jgi:hypothetical protein